MKKYHATLYAPDGEKVHDEYHDTIEQVWDGINTMGSRWIFYPLATVCDDSGTIVEGYSETEVLQGMTEKEAGEYIEKNAEIVSVATHHDEIMLK